MNQNVEMELDPEDGVTEATALELIEDLRDKGGDGQVLATCEGIPLVDGFSLIALIGFALTTASASAIVVSLLYRIFQTGVTINCKGGTVRIRKNKELPRGSVLIVQPNGAVELREGLSQDALAGLLSALLQKPDPS